MKDLETREQEALFFDIELFNHNKWAPDQMGLEELLVNGSEFGDGIFRDAYIRGLALCNNTEPVQQSACTIDSNGTATWVSTIKSRLDSTVSGTWSLSVKPPNQELNLVDSVPQVFVSSTKTTLSSDTVSVKGTLEVRNYALFEDDVDIPFGGINVGKDVSVAGSISTSRGLITNEGLYACTVRSNFVDFSRAWRISYDASRNGVLFSQSSDGGNTYVDRGIITSSGFAAL